MPKTIVFKIWKFPQLSETFVVNQIVTAIKLGYEVKVLVGEEQNFEEHSNIKLIDEYKIRDKIVKEDYKIPLNRFLRITKGFFLMLGFVLQLPAFFRFYKLSSKKEISIIYQFHFYKKFKNIHAFHIQFGTNKFPVDILKKAGLLKGKIIASFHGHDLYFPINNRIHNNGYYNVLFESADYLVSNTPFLKEKLLEINAPISKIKIIPVAVSTNIFIPNFSKVKRGNTVKLVTVGRLETFKGHIWGLRTTELLIKNGCDVTYCIAGSGSLEQELKSEVKKRGLEKYIHFRGKVNQSEVKEILQDSDIFLMTSVTDPDYGVESQGLVTAEAQACGLPVVAFDSGGVKYTLKDGVTGFLCKEKDIVCFTAQVEKLVRNKSLRKKMSDNAVQFVEENFSENSVLEKWKELYS